VRLKLSSAGMPPVLIHRHSAKTVEEVLIKGLPLGAMRNAGYQEREIDLAKGDTVLFMSDGFSELTNEAGETLGYSRAMETFERACRGNTDGGTAQDMLCRLTLATESWCGGQGLRDDLTFVVIRVLQT
jgi:sigma-B regulation protein RsbU (phosphoserine phosphatase)